MDDRPPFARFSAIVVGLGRIGMGYDSHLSHTTSVLSHVRALSIHSDYDLLAGVDPNPALRSEFSKQTGLTAYTSVSELKKRHQPVVAVLASPTATHPMVLEELLDAAKPMAILCEKPLAPSLAQGELMNSKCAQSGVSLFVNFIRRADPGVREIRERIRNGQIQGPFKAVIWYSKGMKHNGSHFVDLLTFWLGPIKRGRIISKGSSLGTSDADADFILECELGTAIFCATSEDFFSHYTVEIVAANGRIRYERGGHIEWQSLEFDGSFLGYRRLSCAPEIISNDMDRYQFNVANELARALRGEDNCLCTGREALDSQSWIEHLYLERE